MQRISWNDPCEARACKLSNAIYGDFQLTFDDFPNLFLRVGMLMDGRSGIELVMGERHVGGIEIAASPAGKTFDRWQLAGIDEGHPTIIR